MNLIPMEVGRVVLSKAGHDQGHYYVIVSVAESPYVMIADGRVRKIQAPKKKKIKHLRAMPQYAGDIAERIASGKQVTDADLRHALDAIMAGAVEP